MQGGNIPAGSTILITGINGHIGSTLVIRSLEEGFSVHGTVRSLEKGNFMSKLLSTDSPYGNRSQYATKFTLYEVPDFSSAEAYSKAMKGADLLFLGTNVSALRRHGGSPCRVTKFYGRVQAGNPGKNTGRYG